MKRRLEKFFADSIFKDKVDSSDLYYLTKRFLGAKISYFIEKADISEEAKEASLIAKKIIQDSEEYLGIDFSNDYELINSLTIHLKVALYRLRNNLAIENILTEQIKYRITFIYEITKKILSQYESQLNCTFPEDEVAYIAMYIGAAFERNVQNGFMQRVLVVCGSGMATSSILSTRLKILIPELKIVGPIAITDVKNKIKDEEFDFIISTVAIEVPGYQIVNVNPLLDVEYINQIKNLRFKKQSDYLAKRYEIKHKDKVLLNS
ncbi:PRD domain-containing protein [Clostridium sp. YIM B02515]|uniref:PRD domain-containing protein n=1 Tax=Clostridium rhizosphaerae TaxID=2803861 RepID=A0ABS1TAS7_9CLOT|nr:PRD domain-containing protein [Clostridium rhizosphaerae]MBL4936207.1 PRD domain-containing protein [Clostridium rhizosphaerae]